MARPQGKHKVSLHLYVEDEVYEYLQQITDGTQSVAGYVLQKSGVIKDYRAWRASHQDPMERPVPIVPPLSCDTCQLVSCDPACPIAHAVHTY